LYLAFEVILQRAALDFINIVHDFGLFDQPENPFGERRRRLKLRNLYRRNPENAMNSL
jgi:hypothetical protein